MFRSATLRMTLWYTAIIMTVSLVFSAVLFSISRTQLETSLRRQVVRSRLGQGLSLPSRSADIDTDLIEGSSRLLFNLFEFNLIILALSVLASYKLARKTLGPIEEVHNAQARFTADASHELRTPLTAMKTEIEVALRDQKLNIVEARDLLASNLEEISKLEFLSNALLKLAQTNKDTIAMTQTNALEIINVVVERLKKSAKLKSITIKNDVRNHKLEGDQASLVELFVVILDNAIKYSPKGASIELASQKTSGCIEISIIDHGVGIKPADLPHIFDRFYRIDDARANSKTAGYGLGLSIAKKVVDLHDGTIDVRSTLGEGSKFSVRLPIEQKV